MIENASLLVYIWSIYGKVVNAMESMMVIVGALVIAYSIFRVINFLEYSEEYEQNLNKVPRKTLFATFIVLVFINILLPKKEYLPYIISASPVAKTIMESYKDGKLNKVDKIIDNSLDKALEALKDSK